MLPSCLLQSNLAFVKKEVLFSKQVRLISNEDAVQHYSIFEISERFSSLVVINMSYNT